MSANNVSNDTGQQRCCAKAGCGTPCNYPCECEQCVRVYKSGGYVPQNIRWRYEMKTDEPDLPYCVKCGASAPARGETGASEKCKRCGLGIDGLCGTCAEKIYNG